MKENKVERGQISKVTEIGIRKNVKKLEHPANFGNNSRRR